MGSRWSVIASQLRGRTDNDVKSYWNTKLKKKILAGKINLSGNSNHIQPTTSAPAIFSVSQSDNQGLSNYLSQRSTTMPLSMDMGSSRLVSDSIQFSIPGLSMSPEFGFNVNNNYITPDVTSHPLLDNNYSSWWPGNGIDEDDNRFFTDIGFGSSFDLFSAAAAPTISNYYDTFLSNTSDTKPQGLYHSITN